MQEIRKLIHEQIGIILSSSGKPAPLLTDETEFLSGELDIDSLDLATLIVNLEEISGKQPFREGFLEFRSIGELTAIFSK